MLNEVRIIAFVCGKTNESILLERHLQELISGDLISDIR